MVSNILPEMTETIAQSDRILDILYLISQNQIHSTKYILVMFCDYLVYEVVVSSNGIP